MSNKNKTVSEVLGTEEKKDSALTNVVANSLDTTVDEETGEEISFESHFESKKGFESVGSELLSKEMLAKLTGISVRALMLRKTVRTIKQESKEGIEMIIDIPNEGKKKLWASQFRFMSTFDEFDAGKGVAIEFMNKGVVQQKGSARTMNDIDIIAKSL